MTVPKGGESNVMTEAAGVIFDGPTSTRAAVAETRVALMNPVDSAKRKEILFIKNSR